jgi:hypothetical protein
MVAALVAATFALVVGLLTIPTRAVEQGTITVTKTWAAGQEPVEVVEVCFVVTSDAGGADVLGEACTSDETYAVTFGPSEPPLQTGVTYYVREEVGAGWAVAGDNPVAVVIPDTTGEAAVAFENRRIDGASVEVHEFVCPPGFESDDTEAYYEACHAAPRAGVAMSAAGPGDLFLEGVTDAAGVVTFRGFGTPGEVTIAESVPTGDFAGFVVGCERVDTGAAIPVEYRTNGRAAVAFDLPADVVDADGVIVCEWYNIPPAPPEATASLTIHVSACPDNVAPDDRFEQCHENGLVGVDFVLQGPVEGDGTTAGHLGAVRWDGLPAGLYTVAEAVPSGDFVDYAVFCSRLDGQEAVPFEKRGDGRAAIQVEVGVGAQVVCDWYNIAPAEVTLLDFRIAAFTCPSDPGDVSLAAGNIPETCAPTVGAAFTVAGADGAQLASCAADADGICVVQLPNEAAVTVTEDVTTLPTGYAPRENPIATEVRTEFAGALFINLPIAPPTLAIEPTVGSGGQTVQYRGEGYTPGGAVTVLMTGDGLIVAEDRADERGAIAGSFRAPDRARLTGESTNDIPVFAIDEATGRESGRVVFTYVAETPTPVSSPTPAVPPTPTPTAGSAIGRPAHLHGGTCADLDPTPQSELNGVVFAEGEAAGPEVAIPAEVSVTVLDLSLDELLADDHAINVHLAGDDLAADGETGSAIVCGEIGGVPVDGVLAVGLREVDGSGFVGFAYLEPDPTNPDRTQVTVFIAPHLPEEEQGTPMADASPAA